MSEFVSPFEVSSKLADAVYRVRFSHLWNAIATRHSDTIDAKFLVEGKSMIVGLAHTALEAFRQRTQRSLTDRELSFLAAEFLRERLEQEDERSLYDVSQAEVLRLAEKIGLC